MPYRKSRARKTFDSEIGSCIAVIRWIQLHGIQNPSLRDYVLSNAIIRTSAKIESYLEDVITDWISELNAAPRPTDQIPSAMRVRHMANAQMIDACRQFIAFQDEMKFSQACAALLGSVAISFGPNGVPCPAVSAPMVLEGRKYPSTKNIKVLFGRLGISSVFSLLNASAGANMQLLIESFNGVRGSLAHVGLPVGYNANDVKRLLREMKRFVRHVDRVLYSHVLNVSGVTTWRI